MGNQAGFSAPIAQVQSTTVRQWFEDPVAVAHYGRAATAVGLWRSEQIVYSEVFDRAQRLLDVGCGAGRISLGLWELGFRRLAGVDFASAMIEAARAIAAGLRRRISYRVADARALPFETGAFGGAIFGFNGLMQIPGREQRRAALRELARVVAGGGALVFTTHDRDAPTERAAWTDERERWSAGRQDARLVDFGDRIIENPEGRIFMHLPDRSEILEDLAATGWQHSEDHARATIANESPRVRDFADECRFWIAHRPADPAETKTPPEPGRR